MLCIRPFRVRPGQEFGCGQCLPCRINRRRIWTARIVLESVIHGDVASAFFTLTYSQECLPAGGTLVPAHLEEFRYRLRYLIGPFRYYFVGEYGERSQRAHYHGLLFGVSPTLEALESVWGRGHCHVGMLSMESAQYCAGYVTKKMTAKDDPRLKGRYPEFARMSSKPGIGTGGLNGIIAWLYSSEGAAYIARNRDVPAAVRVNGKVLPIGRYLHARLRDEFGIPSQDPMRSMRAEALRLENTLPEVMVARELKREGHYDRAKFFVELRRSKEKL